MTFREKLQLEKWLNRHSAIANILGFFVILGIMMLVPLEIAKDKIKTWSDDFWERYIKFSLSARNGVKLLLAIIIFIANPLLVAMYLSK